MRPLLLLIISLLTAALAQAKQYQLDADVGIFITLPAAYALTPDSLDDSFPKGDFAQNPYFQWLDKERTRAIFKKRPASNVSVNLSLLNNTVPVDEVIVDFLDEKFLGCSISVYNRGDSSQLAQGEFLKRQKLLGQHLSTILDTSARKRTANPKKGVMTSGYKWQSARGMAVLECNPEAPTTTEFLRLRLARKGAKGIYAAALQDRSVATVRKSALPKRLHKQGSTVSITGLPMVDQGLKGYCVVASIQRLFEYYGISCDMHQLAQLAQSDPQHGTSSLEVNRQLGKIDYLFKTRYKCLAVQHNGSLVELEDGQYVGDRIPQKDFHKDITRYIDDGIPLLWCLQLGKAQESPPLRQQVSGGHMRMIIGYDLQKRLLIFSDSWGAGHAHKTMSLDDAYDVTTGLYSMVPITN